MSRSPPLPEEVGAEPRRPMQNGGSVLLRPHDLRPINKRHSIGQRRRRLNQWRKELCNCSVVDLTVFSMLQWPSEVSTTALDPVWRTMAMHPRYLESFLEVHEYLVSGDGPLRYQDRLYIAMMVSVLEAFQSTSRGWWSR